MFQLYVLEIVKHCEAYRCCKNTLKYCNIILGAYCLNLHCAYAQRFKTMYNIIALLIFLILQMST